MTEQDDTPEKLLVDMREPMADAVLGCEIEDFAARAEALFAKERERAEEEARLADEDLHQMTDLRGIDLAKLSRLQAVAALCGKNGKDFGYWDYNGFMYCHGCDKQQGQPHADGCPVGRYEAGK